MGLHQRTTGSHRGRRYGVEILNKSGIVLLTACWEAFVEDTASTAFGYMLRRMDDPKNLPKTVRQQVATWLKSDKHELKVWELAGDGWRDVLQAYRTHIIRSHIGSFHTPKAENIDTLFEALLGLTRISEKWSWRRMSTAKAQASLARFIGLRGEIAHRVKASRPVHKSTVNNYRHLLSRLAARTSNETNKHLKQVVGEFPWPMTRHGSVE